MDLVTLLLISIHWAGLSESLPCSRKSKKGIRQSSTGSTAVSTLQTPLGIDSDKVYVRWVSNLLPAITIWDTFLLGQTDRLPESAMHNQCFKARRTWNILTSSNCRSSCSGLFMIGTCSVFLTLYSPCGCLTINSEPPQIVRLVTSICSASSRPW